MEKIYVKVKLDKKSKKKLIADFLLKQPATYANEKRTIVECSSEKARTLDAIYSICKTVFKTTTKKEVAVVLNNLAKDCKIGIVSCPNVKKLTFFNFKNKNWWSFYNKNDGKLTSNMSYYKQRFNETNNSFNDFLKIITK